MIRKEDGEVINYPYAASQTLGANRQLYIRVALEGSATHSNWLAVDAIASRKVDPMERYSPIVHRALIGKNEVYEYQEDLQVWEMIAVAVTTTATLEPAVRDNVINMLAASQVESETEREEAVV